MFDFILPFIALILVVVFIHEYGHYYFAKRYGVGVTDFSIGFGQEIFGWNDKSGTRWKICWIPLGGYVKFFGDRNVFSQADQEKIIKKYLAGMISLGLDGKFAGFPWVDMSNFLGIEMYSLRLIRRKSFKNIMKMIERNYLF